MAMVNAAAHRGPQGARSWSGTHVALGHLALTITPEDERERQPLVEAGIVVSADVRIDNRDELIRHLDGSGHLRTPSPSDAQLLLAAYRCWGIECPRRLIGDYAFVVWDDAQRRLFAARDSMGMRPFYYAHIGNRFVFASEITQLLTHPDAPVELAERMVGAFLTGRPVPLDWTFYEGIRQLPPAHALLVATDTRRVWRYWDIDPDVRIRYRNDRHYAEHFREVFAEAVRARLRSVKPIGLMLSGGIDSGAVGATVGWLFQRERARRLAPELRVYSWAFDRLRQCDERQVSRLIAGHYGFPTTNIAAEEAYPLAGYPEHGPHREEPPIGTYQALHETALAQARAEGVALMMTGYRGDLVAGEAVLDLPGLLLAGRCRALWSDLLLASGQYRRIPKTVAKHAVVPGLLALWPTGWFTRRRLRLADRAAGRRRRPYPDWLRPAFAARLDLDELSRSPPPSHRVGNSALHQRYDTIFNELHMRAVVQVERSAARFGMGFADPWSDRRVAECVLAMPQWRVHQRNDRKRLARLAMAGIIPEEARRQMRKVPLTPLYHYALQHGAKATILSLITDSQVAARGYVHEEKVRDLYDAICRGERSIYGLWEILAVEMWLRRYWR